MDDTKIVYSADLIIHTYLDNGNGKTKLMWNWGKIRKRNAAKSYIVSNSGRKRM